MIVEIISKNDENQRLDRFLKKYYKKASLSHIYKLIRKDIKVNEKRVKEDYMLKEKDEIYIYISSKESESLMRSNEKPLSLKKQFNISYENENIIIVSKPFGLLTHGDKKEKKHTLTNQVLSYLMENGEYNPREEKTFSIAPVNRLDRNTTGLVIFAKNGESLRRLNRAFRERKDIKKYYLTIVGGELKEKLYLKDKLVKDESKNIVRVQEEGKDIETLVTPLKSNGEYTLVEVELLTGRTHQIRIHLMSAGYPLIGDVKYGDKKINSKVKEKYNLTTQLLHAYRLEFSKELKKDLNMEMAIVEDDIGKNFKNIVVSMKF